MDKMHTMMEMIVNIDSKLGEIIPQVNRIESRLAKLEGCFCSDLSEIKSSTAKILNDVRSSVQSASSLSGNFKEASVSDSSDTVS